MEKNSESVWTKVFTNVSVNAEKLAPAASTKDVESMNNLYAAKAPKRINYSRSNSLKNRIKCAVSQKNVGYNYLETINKHSGLSLGSISVQSKIAN